MIRHRLANLACVVVSAASGGFFVAHHAWFSGAIVGVAAAFNVWWVGDGLVQRSS